MSDYEKVFRFNPIIVLIWISNLLIAAMDYNPDKKFTWSIPFIGSVIVIQLYMIWKTNYDEMIEEEREKRRQKMGGLVGNTPLIKPGVTDLKQIHSTDTHMVNLNISPNVVDDEEE